MERKGSKSRMMIWCTACVMNKHRMESMESVWFALSPTNWVAYTQTEMVVREISIRILLKSYSDAFIKTNLI